MTKEFQCRWNCGTLLHYDNGQVVDGSNAKHWCPNYPKRQAPKVLQSFDELEHEIELAIEHIINVANAVSKTTYFDIIAKPKDAQQN